VAILRLGRHRVLVVGPHARVDLILQATASVDVLVAPRLPAGRTRRLRAALRPRVVVLGREALDLQLGGLFPNPVAR
jgi:hypothetical protein